MSKLMSAEDIEIFEQGGEKLLELAKENQRHMTILRQNKDDEDEDDDDEAELEAEYSRRVNIPQTPLLELDSFNPRIGLKPDDLAYIRKEIAYWVEDLAAPAKPILSVVIGESNMEDLLYDVMDNDFRKSLRPPGCYLKFCSSSESHSFHEAYKYPGFLTDGPHRVVLWLISGG